MRAARRSGKPPHFRPPPVGRPGGLSERPPEPVSAHGSGEMQSIRRPSLPPQSYLQVVVADDDASIRKLVVRMLEAAGISVLQAEDGEHALQLVRSQGGRVGSILLDVMMPKKGGFEVLQALKQDPKLAGIPVMMLTAHASREEDIVRGIQLGAADHVEKPFRGAVLVAKVRALCNQRQQELDLEQRLKMAEMMAATDPLTGLGNRRHFQTQLALEVAFTERRHEPFCLLLLDLDNFKPINDTFGHPEGDRVLCYVAERVRESLRLSDQGFRLGGDEFAVLLRSTDSDGGLLVARRLINSVSGETFAFANGEQRKIGISVGVAAADAANSFLIDHLIERADHALYRAKDAGTNQAVLEF